jgi:hypothetical protein
VNWWPWLLLLIAVISTIVLYFRMDSYRRQVHAEEALPQHDVDTLQRRLENLSDRKEDYWILCNRLARSSQSWHRRALADTIDDLEKGTVPGRPGFAK